MASGEGWLKISTEGFASFNQSRPPSHLAKELVQNAFDAMDEAGGVVHLDYRHDRTGFHIECRDSGSGIIDLSAMRVVYLTFKTDSHLKRGRFGRGFKEILSVAQTARVQSGAEALHFLVEDGEQITRHSAESPIKGSYVTMRFDWPAETVQEFDHYFARFLVPRNVTLVLNGKKVKPRTVRHHIEAQLTTEVYQPEKQSWSKPRRKTALELVDVAAGEDAFIYEMGIPVAPAEWTVPFHANILQRVPMNPNRDALASGYAKRVHAACLATLLSDLDEETVKADWVGAAGVDAAPEVQKEIVAKAFGKNAVRSVPAMGKRDFDDDANRIGVSVVKTAQMSGGFREMAKVHLPTAKEVVLKDQAMIAAKIAANQLTPEQFGTIDGKNSFWIKKWGKQRIERCLSFAVWFCQKLVDSTGEKATPVTGAFAFGNDPDFIDIQVGRFLAHWSDQNRLTLALDCECFWVDPLGPQSLAILIHEAAHGRNMHHGQSFHEEVERLGGVAAAIMFEHAEAIRRDWPDLLPTGISRADRPQQKSDGWVRSLLRS